MHLGIIPDGNRRYADNKGISNRKAYQEAKDVIEGIGKYLEKNEKDVNEVSFYLLSEENLKRDDEELETLFTLLREHVNEISERYSKNGFVFNWATTHPQALPEDLIDELRGLEDRFDKGDKKLNLLISYDGKSDILQAAEETGSMDRENFRQNLEINTNIDFVIRTGDNPTRECVSGFPIWNSSYAEYRHIKKNFPKVDNEDIKESLEHFRELRRKKGK